MPWNPVPKSSDSSYLKVARDVAGFTLAQMTEPLAFYIMLLSAFDTNDFSQATRASDDTWNPVTRPS